MATEVKLPDEAQGVENITVNRWLVKVGDTVKNGDPLLEVATEKVDTQIQSPADGVVLQVNFGEGDIVPPDAILALIGSSDESNVAVPARAGRARAYRSQGRQGETSAVGRDREAWA